MKSARHLWFYFTLKLTYKVVDRQALRDIVQRKKNEKNLFTYIYLGGKIKNFTCVETCLLTVSMCFFFFPYFTRNNFFFL